MLAETPPPFLILRRGWRVPNIPSFRGSTKHTHTQNKIIKQTPHPFLGEDQRPEVEVWRETTFKWRSWKLVESASGPSISPALDIQKWQFDETNQQVAIVKNKCEQTMNPVARKF